MIPYTYSHLYLTYIWKNKFILKKSLACTNVSDEKPGNWFAIAKELK